MKQTTTIYEKGKLLLVMLFPILITQLGMFSMMFFNTIMSGKYHSTDLAGVAIGSSIWGPIFTGISSILLAVSPIAAQRLGQKQEKEVSSVLTHGIYLALIISVFVILFGVFFLQAILDLMNLHPNVEKTAYHYLVGLSLGIIPLFLYNVLRSFIYALGKTRIVMVILLTVLPINLVLNYALIFGKWGLPELGGAGGGYATSFTYWIILMLTFLVIKTQHPFTRYVSLARFSLQECKEILKIGVPMGLSTFFETSMFAVVTILISKFTVSTIAAYQAALNIVSFLYMIPMSISIALTVVVGFEVGAKRYRDAKVYSWLGVGLSIFIATITGLLVVIFRYEVAGFYSNEADVIHLTATFLIYALFFQVSDAIQATAQAALRGYKDVNVSFVLTLIAYWLICLPVGYSLAHFTNLGVKGYWIGLTIGLLIAGIGLSYRLWRIQSTKYVHIEETNELSETF
ncbi:MATE family efflux transporter [Cytobacillus spongiae]|uniref:MATE family efflux transporter n=1 Tax=Cytobacillus spongiae TaxID=2901381 RepID=UPI001F31AC2C|nr:MATE family efflux transporter [Cytobacillus spongiae]UII57910.1 MATE family efflux transporter [Cytobacillus spongiae]